MATINEIMQKYGYQQRTGSLLENEEYRKYLQASYDEANREKNNGGVLGGIGYFFEQLGLGALSVVEGVWDFTAGGLADLFGADQWAEEQFANDWVNYNHANEWFNPTDGWRTAGDVASGLGNTLVGVGVGLATGGSGWVVMGTVGLGAAGNATKEAYKQTGELGWKEYGYGLLSGATEAALEKVTGGTERMIKNLSKNTAKTVVKKSLLKEIGKDFISEAFEEGMSEFLDPYYKRWTQVDPEAKNATWQQVGYSALVGGLSGMLGGRFTAGIGSADSAIRATKRGGKIASSPEQLKNTVETATRVADYETEHNTGKGIYQHVKGLVEKFKGLDKGNGVVSIGQKRLLGEMERANIALAYEPEVEKSKQKILANPDEFIKAVNEKGLIDGTGKPIHIESVEALKNNSELLTHFAVADALGQILRSGNSVYDLVMSKGTTDGIVQAEFRRLQKEGNAQQKAAMNETFGIDIDSITYEEFIDKVQSTSRDVMVSKQTAIKTRKQAKDAISHAINTNADIGVLDSNTAFTEGMSVFKTKDGKYVSVSKQGDSYYLYADGNISLPLTKAKLKSTIKALNGEQTQTKPKKKKPTATQVTATTQGTQTTAPVVTPQVAPSSDTTPTPTTTAPTTETGVNKPQTATPSNQSTETRTGEETTENKPKATNSTEDFGEKIGGARKDTWQKRGLLTSDLMAMNRRELQQHVKKENVWKRPDFVKAIAEGGDRATLYIQNELYKSINATPYIRRSVATDTTSTAFQEAMEKYVAEIREVQKLAEGVKSKEDLSKITKWLIEKGYLNDTGSAYSRYSWTEAYYNSPALYGSKIFETTRKLEKGFDSLAETALMEGFGVDKADKLPNGYTIKRINSFWDNAGTKYVIVKGGKHGSYASPYFTSYEEAFAYGKEKFGTAETATTGTDGKKQRYVPPQLKDVHRNGADYRKGKNAVGDDFLRDFGIKGGEFGNWLSETDRTTSLNYGYDAFCDLADALGIELTDISLNGTLSIGFGSRGKGLSGAAAHYEPARKVINLTKMNGAGSLAHEFWHAVEDYASGDTHQHDMASDFSKMPERTRQAGRALLNAINYKDKVVEIEEINENRAKALERNLRHLERHLNSEFKIFGESMTAEDRAKEAKMYRYKRVPTDAELKRFAELRAQAVKGVSGVYNKFFAGEQTIVDELNALLKDVKGRGMDKDTRRTLALYIEQASSYSEQAVETQTKRVKTQFHEDALAISKTYAKDGGYWDSNCEMLARAFASYIHTKTDGKNDYLSGHALGATPVVDKNGNISVAYIYPHDTAEAEAIYKAFDDFFAAAKADGLFHEATRTKPTTTVRYAMSEDTQLNTTPNGSKGQVLKPLQMKHAENVARNNIKGYENLTEAEKLEVEWTLASAWRAGKSTTEALKLARLSTAIGAGVGFADISTKTTDGKTVTPDAACYTRGGHLTIYLNPNGKRTIEAATLHELAHSLEGMEGYEDIKAMAEKYYAEHPAEKKAIDDMYREVYKNEQVRYAEEILTSELTAHYVESMLSKRDMLAKLTKENPTFTQKCIEKIKAIRNKLTKADRNANMSEVDMLETRFTTIFNLNKGKIAKNSNLSGVKLSIKKINGKDTVVVDTDQHIFDGVERADLGKTVSAYMKERYRGRIVNGVAFTAQSEREYTHSRDSKRLFNQTNGAYEAKMRASTELNNLVITGEFMQDETAKHPQRINEGGVKRYKVSFVMSDKVFEGEMIIAIDKNGVGTFYDIVKIKESDSSNDAPNGVVRTNALSTNSISESSENVNPETDQTTKNFALSAKNTQNGKFNVEDFLFDDDYYATYQYESREQITETIEELEKVKASKSFEGMSFDEQYEITSKIKALKAGYTTLYDYIVETDKQRLLDDWQYHIERGINNRASRMVEEKLKRIEKEEKLQADISNASKLQNAQYEIIQKSNPMFDDYHVGIRSPKDIKTFAEVIDDTDSFNWGDFTREDAQNALKRGKIRVFSSYPIKNGVFVSTSYQQALDYAGGNPNGVHSREVALESVAWINGDEGQYAKVYSYSESGTVRYALSPEDIKGSDRVTTELPDKKVRLRDVITGKSTFGELKGQIKGGTSEQTEAFRVLMTNAQAAVERVAGEMGVTDATAWTNFVRAGKNASFNAIEKNGGQYSLDGEIKVGDSLGRIWQPIYAMDKKDGQALKLFDTYLLHWHNIDRMAIGKPVFGDDVTVDDSMAEIEKIEAEYPEFRRIAEKVWQFNDNNLQLSVDSGMYSQEYADHLRELYPHYVPTMRTEHRAKVNALMGKNSLFVNNAKKKAKGSDAEILPIDDQIAAQTIQKTTSARINAFLVKMLESGKHDEFQILSSEDADIDIDTETEVITHEDKAKGTHQVTFYHNGKIVTAQVSKLVYKGIEAFRPSSSMSDNIAIAVVQKLNSLFKKGVTSWNPFFSFFKNPMRDLQDALLYTRYSHATYLKNLNRARQEISGNGNYWQEAKAAGITSSSVYDYEKGVGYKEKGVFGKAKEVMRKVENASNAIEMAPRLAEYISARESGLSVQEALLQAQDVTTNFGRGGTFAKILNSTVMPFLNPSIQGFSKMWRSYVGKEAAQSWINLIIRSLLLGIGMTALNDLLNGDDEEYEDLSDYVKEQNYVIALGDGDFLKIPKGRVTSVFGGAFLRGKRYANGDADAWEGYWDSVKSAVTPVDNFTRTIFSPFTDISTNTAWHGGTIESQKWDNTEPKNRYDETTSSIAIWLGQVFNYSPIKIEYLLEQYGGIVADIALPATSTQAEKGIISQNMLANSTLNSKWSNEFYTSLEDYTYKKTAGDSQAKGVVRYLNSVKSTVSDLYTQKSKIQADKNLSKDEKLTQTKIIQTTINALQQEAVLNTEYLYNELGKYDLSTDEAYEQAYLDCISVIMGAEYALQSYNKDVYSKAVNLNKLGVSYETYYDYYFGVKSITSDKNADGSTVSGSKKAKVIAYTMAQNMPTAQKIILIMNAGYTITDGDISGMTAKQAKTAVAKYITNLKISRAEKEELAKMFGFTVKLGKIYIN